MRFAQAFDFICVSFFYETTFYIAEKFHNEFSVKRNLFLGDINRQLFCASLSLIFSTQYFLIRNVHDEFKCNDTKCRSFFSSIAECSKKTFFILKYFFSPF